MRFLIDSHLLLWAALRPDRLPAAAYTILETPGNELSFSVVSIWEIAIKTGLNPARSGSSSLQIDPGLLRRKLIANGYAELLVTSEHAIATSELPAIHKDPFDRLLVAQAEVEGMTLVTSDVTVARYHVPYRRHVQQV